MEDTNNINDILWDRDPKNAVFDLELLEIPKTNFDPLTPLRTWKIVKTISLLPMLMLGP